MAADRKEVQIRCKACSSRFGALPLDRFAQRVGRETDPLGPEDVLLVGAGLLTGVAEIANSRISFSAKSARNRRSNSFSGGA